MKIVFADTSGFYAALDRADPFHAEAARCFRRAKAEGWRLVTSNYVIHARQGIGLPGAGQQ